MLFILELIEIQLKSYFNVFLFCTLLITSLQADLYWLFYPLKLIIILNIQLKLFVLKLGIIKIFNWFIYLSKFKLTINLYKNRKKNRIRIKSDDLSTQNKSQK